MQQGINYKDRYNPAFVNWINSINSGFQNKIEYQPFTDYVQQAEEWQHKSIPLSDFLYRSEKIKYVGEEVEKFRASSLYGLNKLLMLQDPAAEGGMKKYIATPAQQVFLFLLDMAYNLIMGKGRQIGFTTTFGGVSALRISYINGYFIKFITHNDKKGEEIFRDKIQYAFRNIDPNFRVGAYNYSKEEITTIYDNGLTSSGKKNKIDKNAYNGKIMKVVPADDAISGGTPNLVGIDEVALVENYGEIVADGEPTMFGYDEETGQLVNKQQLVSWGSSATPGGRPSIFKEYINTAKEQWEKKNFNYGIVPVFFNAFARQGMSWEFWNQRKQNAENSPEKDREKNIIRFWQSYPIVWDDMFVSASKTIIPFTKITDNIQRIRVQEHKSKYGYFDIANGDIQDYIDRKLTAPMPEPIFIPTRGITDPLTTTIMDEEPESDWAWRYYKGTDTISTRNGHSKFSSSIWDELKKKVTCTVNFRSQNFKECFMQSVLQALYYSNKHHAVRDLIELNNGDGYMEFVENLGLKKMLIYNSMLPPRLQTPDSLYGIRKGSNTSGKINDNLLDLLENYSGEQNIEELFLQLKTFVAKEKETGYLKYAPESRFDFDDLLDGASYSYMAAQCYSRHEPKRIGDIKDRAPVIKYVYDSNWQLRRAKVYADGKKVFL